jgi:hypothetical protein
VRAALAVVLLALASPALVRAGEIPGAIVVLEAAPGTPGSDSSGAPPRFVLLKDGQVFVSGTSLVETGRLEKAEADALAKRAAALRKLPGVTGPVSFGGAGERVFRLRLLEKDPVEIVATGDTAQAPAALAPLAGLIDELLRFQHSSLRPYAPESYALGVHEARLAGGCRAWDLPLPIAQATAGRHAVKAADAASWPTGALPASVCADDKHYVVTLRPLLPGEQP